MKLYHFTSRFHIDGCLKDGLTKGSIPVSINPPQLLIGFQWLTRSKKFRQSWSEYSSLPYDRTDFRITIKIPKYDRKNLIDWLKFCETYEDIIPCEILNSFGDPYNWMLFKGTVKPKWFRNIDRNPSNF